MANGEVRKNSGDGPVAPFLARFAVARTGRDELSGRYCPERHVWLVEGEDGGEVPLASLPAAAPVGITVTKVLGEQTDQGDAARYAGTGPVTTVTAVEMEGTDTKTDLSLALWAATITEVQSEQIDK